MPPSVTLSSRIFIAMGVTEVIGSTPVDIDLRELFDKRQNGIELALEIVHLLLGNRNAGEMGNAADGIGINGHRTAKTLDGP